MPRVQGKVREEVTLVNDGGKIERHVEAPQLAHGLEVSPATVFATLHDVDVVGLRTRGLENLPDRTGKCRVRADFDERLGRLG